MLGIYGWWRRFLGIPHNGYRRLREILRERYIKERQHASRFRQHAAKMQYPQFREKLLEIAAEEARHAEWIAEKLKHIGSDLPEVPATPSGEQNSWQYLLSDLEEEAHCADELLEAIRRIEPENPEIAELLERIHKDGEKHRNEIRAMLMRSDPQALWPA